MLLITSFCTRLYADKTAFILNIVIENNVDLVFLQETWLHQSEFKEMKDISKDYLTDSVSGIQMTEIIKGKGGYGGVSIL